MSFDMGRNTASHSGHYSARSIARAVSLTLIISTKLLQIYFDVVQHTQGMISSSAFRKRKAHGANQAKIQRFYKTCVESAFLWDMCGFQQSKMKAGQTSGSTDGAQLTQQVHRSLKAACARATRFARFQLGLCESRVPPGCLCSWLAFPPLRIPIAGGSGSLKILRL